MPVVVEVADKRHAAARLIEPVADHRDRLRRFRRIHRQTHQLGSRAGEFQHLGHRLLDIRGRRIRHRLNHDRVARAHSDIRVPPLHMDGRRHTPAGERNRRNLCHLSVSH